MGLCPTRAGTTEARFKEKTAYVPTGVCCFPEVQGTRPKPQDIGTGSWRAGLSGKVQGHSKLNSRFHYLRGQSFLLAAVRCLEFVPGD